MRYIFIGYRRSIGSATRVRLAGLAVVAFLGMLIAHSPLARAQDDYKINYFANNLPAPVSDETVRIVNPQGSDRCADLYVFDANQSLQECCGCLITHNGLLTLSVRSQLTANPLSSTVPITGVIKLLSSLPSPPGVCNPVSLGALTPTLRAWSTHNQSPSPSPVVQKVTEEEFEDAPLDPLELGLLQDSCEVAQVHKSVCACAITSAPGP